jgi:hypothetical protein
LHRVFSKTISIFYKVACIWENPIWAGLFALAVYLAYALHVNPTLKTSDVNYHNYLADALLNGQVFLRHIPLNSQVDLIQFNDKYFLYWPPLPAILLMPFVTIWGINFSDVVFTLVIATLNVSLVAVLLRGLNKNGIANTSSFQRSVMVLFFAFGSVHFTIAPYGRVWFTSSAMAFFFSILAYITAISRNGRKAFFLTGLAVACGMMTRNTILFSGIWPAYYLLRKNRSMSGKDLIKLSLLGILPIFLFGVLFLAYNESRFGNPFDTGIQNVNYVKEFASDIETYGFFNYHYIKRNFYYHFLFYPFPETAETLQGGSLFLLSPVFFAAFLGAIKGKPRISVLILALTVLAADMLILLFFGTGWFQFGPRYTLDFTVPLLILTAMGLQYIPDWLLVVLSMISAAHYYKGMSILNMIWRS